MQITLNRQYASGVTIYASYVWSKTMSNMASLQFGNNGAHPLDYYNLSLESLGGATILRRPCGFW